MSVRPAPAAGTATISVNPQRTRATYQSSIALPNGERIPRLGQSTRGLAAAPARRADEIAALRLGVDLGLSLIDAVDAPSDAGAQCLGLVNAAVRGRRDEVFLVVRAVVGLRTARGTVAACERSLRSLGTDRIDLYVLPVATRTTLHEALVGVGALLLAGKIRLWGVNDFDVDAMTELARQRHGGSVAVNQVHYNLRQRGIERELLPWSDERSIPLMAYSPLSGGGLLRHPAVMAVADRHGATSAQVALAWVLRDDGVCATTRARTPAHIRENRRALDLRLDGEDIRYLDDAFRPEIAASSWRVGGRRSGQRVGGDAAACPMLVSGR